MMMVRLNGGGGAKRLGRWLVLLVAVSAFVESRAQRLPPPASPETAQEVSRAERSYEACRQRWRQQPNNAEAGWQFGRASFTWADRSADSAQRAAVAREAIAACRRAIGLQPKLGPAHYYLAMNCGQLAQTQFFGALKLVKEMETEFKTAAELDPGFDFAGAYRLLGELYSKAPGAPMSIGDRSKARECLGKAVEICPEFPGNQIGLMELCLKCGQEKLVQSRLDAVEDILKSARVRLNGEQWSLDWKDWDRRWAAIKDKTAGGATIRSASASHG